ncbi:MAG: glycosyltransferase [Anaerolineae bacterium]|nr:glycosyltransferase [Thermoflexales bacterium]MCX7939912.1 glycosyltransferase [Thermoflexales bacterium]MDW8293359.1 glycosyltransferase [Anaerolineae bacterium]
MDLIAIVHTFAVCALAIQALHHTALLLVFLFGSKPRPCFSRASSASDALPRVTVQVPIYNERAVVERVLCAVAAQDYPSDRLRIQVLDDSDDETRFIVCRVVERLRAQGVRVELIQREARQGFKAGALAEGLRHTEDDLIAIFDADFVPPPDFLRRAIAESAAFADPHVGFVQARWTFANAEHSAVTRAQKVMLDVHFVVEQTARASAGLPISFNGSAGIWRRECILDAGGWQADTLTEDLDLCYRAQMRGWRGAYLPWLCIPSELPSEALSYKRQQARWARGTVQVLRKVLPMMPHAPWSWLQRIAALFHLSGYFIHAWVLLTALTTPLLVLRWMFGGEPLLPAWVGALGMLCTLPTFALVLAQRAQGVCWSDSLKALPFALALGIGVSLSNTVAMLSALLNLGAGTFERTPKRGALWRSPYPLRADWTLWAELLLACYSGVAAAMVFQHSAWLAALPLLLYSLGFGFTAAAQLLALAQEQPRRIVAWRRSGRGV